MFIVLFLVLAMVLHWHNLFVTSHIRIEELKSLPPQPEIAVKTEQKPFVYFTQCPGDAPEWMKIHFQSNISDFFFITFKEKIVDVPFFPNSTWSSGRNHLFEKHSDGHLYAVFLDCDCTFSSPNAVQLWQKELLKYSPPVAIPFYKPRPRYDVPIFYLPMFDMIFVAYRKDTWKHLLPYDTRFETMSWYYSGWIQIYRAAVLYFGGVSVIRSVSVRNNLHGTYPRGIFLGSFFGKYAAQLSISPFFHFTSTTKVWNASNFEYLASENICTNYSIPRLSFHVPDVIITNNTRIDIPLCGKWTKSRRKAVIAPKSQENIAYAFNRNYGFVDEAEINEMDRGWFKYWLMLIEGICKESLPSISEDVVAIKMFELEKEKMEQRFGMSERIQFKC